MQKGQPWKQFMKELPLGGSLPLGSRGSNGMRRSLGSPKWSCGGPLKSGPGGPEENQSHTVITFKYYWLLFTKRFRVHSS